MVSCPVLNVYPALLSACQVCCVNNSGANGHSNFETGDPMKVISLACTQGKKDWQVTVEELIEDKGVLIKST